MRIRSGSSAATCSSILPVDCSFVAVARDFGSHGEDVRDIAATLSIYPTGTTPSATVVSSHWLPSATMRFGVPWTAVLPRAWLMTTASSPEPVAAEFDSQPVKATVNAPASATTAAHALRWRDVRADFIGDLSPVSSRPAGTPVIKASLA